jgi:hypothetical protein
MAALGAIERGAQGRRAEVSVDRDDDDDVMRLAQTPLEVLELVELAPDHPRSGCDARTRGATQSLRAVPGARGNDCAPARRDAGAS